MSKLIAKPPSEIVCRRPTILIHGEPNSGKTMGALGWPKPYLVDTEGGATRPQYVAKLARSAGAYVGPDDGALDFDVVLAQVQALAVEQHSFQTLIIDSFSKLFQTAVAIEQDRLRARGQNMSATYGAEKKPAISQTKQLIRRLDRLDMTTLLICHETSLWKNGQAVGTTFDGWEKLAYELDLVLQVIANGTQRIAKVSKSRIESMPKGTAFSWDYAEFAKRLADSSRQEASNNEV
jgi:hypothetical protein